MEKVVDNLKVLMTENEKDNTDLFQFMNALLSNRWKFEDDFRHIFDKVKERLPVKVLCTMYEKGNQFFNKLLTEYAEKRYELKKALLHYNSYYNKTVRDSNLSNKEKIDLISEVRYRDTSFMESLRNPTAEELKLVLQKFKSLSNYECKYLVKENKNNSIWGPEELIGIVCKFPTMLCCLPRALTMSDIDKMIELKFQPTESFNIHDFPKFIADKKTMAYFCYHYPSYCFCICNDEPQNKTLAYVVLFRIGVLGVNSNFSVSIYEKLLAKFVSHAISKKFPQPTASFEEVFKCFELLN